MSKKGFTLLEVIIAIFLITIGITGTMILINRTVGQMAPSLSQLTAAYLGQEGIEIIRNIRDTNWLEQRLDPNNSWDEGLIGCPTGCEADYTVTSQEDPTLALYVGDHFLLIDANGFYNYTSGDPSKFTRKITIVPGDLDGQPATNEILKVKVEVIWTERGKLYTHTAWEDLYNWR